MKWNVDHLPAFIAVAEQGGISAAARLLAEPKSTVSRAVTRLEEDVGLQLFVRGALTVALPMAFGREIVGPHLAGFQASFPDVRLDLRIGSGQPDLIRDAIDIAVVVGLVADSDLIRQQLIDTPLIWIAAPDVAANLPEDPLPEELAPLIRVAETRYAGTSLSVSDDTRGIGHITLDSKQMMKVNDPIMLREIVRSGGGLSFAPDIYCRAAIADGTLVQLYPHIHIREESSLSLLYPGRRLVPKKTQAFMDFLRSICARQRDLER